MSDESRLGGLAAGGPACEPFRHDLGGYVLDGLTAEETRALEEHLETCPHCHAEREEIADAPALLELARQVGPPAPARLRDRIIAEAARRRLRRRWALAAAAAAALGVLLGGVAGWQLAPTPAGAVAVNLEGVEPFEEAGGWAWFQLDDGAVIVELDLVGLDPLPEPAVYEAWLSTHDDEVISIGQLATDPAGAATASFVVQGPAGAYRGFWITAEPDAHDPAHDGPTVLRGPVPPVGVAG